VTAAATFGWGWLVGVYLAPLIVGVARRSGRLPTIFVLDVLLGWSIIGWIWALVLAVGPTPGRGEDEDAAVIDELLAELHASTVRPRFEARGTAVETVFVDGTYLVSEGDDARTWAVFQDGRWGIVYERNGVQAVASWVLPDDIPLHVRAHALKTAGVEAEGSEE
jgi:hypothetical protein